jgi:endonuclease/exonuclease/phosphatase family metal-dependent hydrolase
VRIASFNVESLFDRALAMSGPTWATGRVVLQQQAEVNDLLGEEAYTPAIKQRLVTLLIDLGLAPSDDGPFVTLRQDRGELLRRAGGSITITASGRDDWIGWLDLKTGPVDEVATQNTARVLVDLGADVQAVVEAESRIALRDFSDVLLAQVGGTPFDHVMLIDGNDLRGIDVGILTRTGFDITGIRSHVDDVDDAGPVFSRDCPEYTIATPGGAEIMVLVNHLKSQGYGRRAVNDARRRRQAVRVAQVYARLVAEGHANVVVCGDFNDPPDSAALAPLLADTDLRDVSVHPSFDDGGRPGTFGTCTARHKFDDILLSPALFARVQGGGIFRRGAWGGARGTLWEHYPTVANAEQAASDHCAIWADLDL